MEQETLFERNMGADHGLGLYLVRTLIERYGGTVELTETGPEGSTFTVELPRADVGVESSQPGPARTPGRDEASSRSDGDEVANTLLEGR